MTKVFVPQGGLPTGRDWADPHPEIHGILQYTVNKRAASYWNAFLLIWYEHCVTLSRLKVNNKQENKLTT